MTAIVTSLMLALRQLADPNVLRVLFKSLIVSIILFLGVAWLGWFAIDLLLEWSGLSDDSFTGAWGLRGIISALISVMGLWLTWRIVAMAVIGFYSDEVVYAVESAHYPDAASTACEPVFREQLQNALGASGRALLVNLIALPFALLLLFTGIGTALVFFVVNAALLGRELQDMVWLRHRQDTAHKAPVSKMERFMLGGAITALLSIPILNFLAPALGAAGAAHLVHRKDWGKDLGGDLTANIDKDVPR